MKSTIYKLLRLRNDLNAIRRGRVGRRIARRTYGRATGRAARRLFK
ncbi:MAG TPA: hypothetical protein VFZ68_13575 [Acidimicrobiales bacterium]